MKTSTNDNVKRTAVKKSFSRKNAALNVTNLLDLITPSNIVNNYFYKPDNVIKRRVREMGRMVSAPSTDYALLAEYASDVLMAAKKALNEKNKKK
jgi:hypothetical protein